MVGPEGYRILPHDPVLLRWAEAARQRGEEVLSDPQMRATWLRHGGTWFVGVDALPNASDGSVDGVPLPEGVRALWPGPWHKAQLSVVFPGYPRRDEGETDAAHRFRCTRDAAHVDGLHREDGRRILREPHAFILGLPLDTTRESPLVVWEGSHEIMRDALSGAKIGDDVTEAYTQARRAVFETCKRTELGSEPGQAILLNRLLVHGVAPWAGPGNAPRRMAYFRPILGNRDRWA